jgi:hypothetical protein
LLGLTVHRGARLGLLRMRALLTRDSSWRIVEVERMKNSTALKQSRGSVRFLAVVVPGMWGLCFWLRWWQLAAMAGFMSLYLLGDVWNLRRINKARERDPDYLKKKVPGT